MITSNISKIIEKYRRLRLTLTQEIVKGQARTVKYLIDQGFAKQVDPYGSKWPTLNNGERFDKLGHIRKSINVSNTKDAVEISSSLVYTKYHQTGTKHLPQRMMIPDPSKGLGNWEGALQKSNKLVIQQIMK